jgi:hypothetical protein
LHLHPGDTYKKYFISDSINNNIIVLLIKLKASVELK